MALSSIDRQQLIAATDAARQRCGLATEKPDRIGSIHSVMIISGDPMAVVNIAIPSSGDLEPVLVPVAWLTCSSIVKVAARLQRAVDLVPSDSRLWERQITRALHVIGPANAEFATQKVLA